MDPLAFVYRHGVWFAVPAFAAGVFLLVQCVGGLVRTGRQARLFAVPLADSQQVAFADAGPVVLEMEGPLFSRRMAGLKYALVGPDGVPVRSRPALFRASTSGVSKGTLELRVFEIARPGAHVFRIEGLGAARDRDAEHRMIFKRPHLGTSIALVVGIVASSALAIGSIVLFALRVANVGGS